MLAIAITPTIRSKFALHIAVACAASIAAAGQAGVSGDFAVLVDIGGGGKILSGVPWHREAGCLIGMEQAAVGYERDIRTLFREGRGE